MSSHCLLLIWFVRRIEIRPIPLYILLYSYYESTDCHAS
jgi:hypothetical protein